jgi:hypothetical protein
MKTFLFIDSPTRRGRIVGFRAAALISQGWKASKQRVGSKNS